MRSQILRVRTDAADVVVTGASADEHAPSAVSVSGDADIVEVWGQDSFPASDPPANW